jgi:UDP-glucose 6-dehydrogenase
LTPKAHQAGTQSASQDAAAAIDGNKISFICVGTPSMLDGNLDLKYVRRVWEDIDRALQLKRALHLVAFRNTVFPGSKLKVDTTAYVIEHADKEFETVLTSVHPEIGKFGRDQGARKI